MPDFGVIGSCQVYGIAASLKVWSPGSTAYPLNAGLVSSMDESAQEALADKLAACDAVYVESVDRIKTGPLSKTALAERVRLISYPVVVFTGLHPDCVHVYKGGTPVQTHMGPYNSALTLAAFNEGLTPERTAALFNRFVLASLGYLAQREASNRDLDQYFTELGYDCSAFVGTTFMHSINHPKIEVLHDLARQALDVGGFERNEDTSPPNDTLLEGAIWPIYSDLADGSEYVFRGHANKGDQRDFTLIEFIESSFDAYRQASCLLTAAAVKRAQDFIQSEVRL